MTIEFKKVAIDGGYAVEGYVNGHVVVRQPFHPDYGRPGVPMSSEEADALIVDLDNTFNAPVFSGEVPA